MSDATFTVTIAGLELQVVDLTDQWKHSIARHRSPGRNGASLEWLGADEGEFRLKTTFIGADSVGDYTDLLTTLRKGEVVSVTHPICGTFDALVEAVAAKYDHRISTGEVEFTIIEDGQDWSVTYAPNASDVAIAKSQAAIDSTCKDIAKDFAPSDPPTVDMTSASWLSAVYALNLGNTINSYMAKVATAVGRIDALQAAITSATSAAFNALTFAEDLPGVVAQKIATLLDAMSCGVLDADNPVLATTNLSTKLTALNASFKGSAVESSVRVLGAVTGARMAAAVLAKDEDRLNAVTAVEESVTFDISGNYVGEAIDPSAWPATPDQVGRMVASMRSLLADALAYTSDPQALEDLARALHQQYRDRLVRYETLREITVASSTPLHLICLQHNLSYNCAERLVRLNQIRNPSFVEGTIRIYVS